MNGVIVNGAGPVGTPSLEGRLALAQAEGLEANLLRQLRFSGGSRGAVELQAVGVRRNVEDSFERVRAAHATSSPIAVRLAHDADAWHAQGLYIIPSRLRAGVETRRTPDAWHDLGKGTGTTDADVAARRVLPLDFDVARAARISATDIEMALSVSVALDAWRYLAPIVGEGALALVHSGNGRQIHIALDDVADAADVKLIVCSILAGADALWSTSRVKVDLKMADAKRLVPACGTLKKKGASGFAERPHRRTAILVPSQLRRVDLDGLRQLCARIRADVDEPGRAAMDKAMGIKPAPRTGPGPTKVSASPKPETGAFKTANALDPIAVAEWLDLFDAGVLRCPGCGESQGVDVLDHGLKCQHDRCNGKGRAGYRGNVDLTMEVHGVDARAAVNELAERFGFEGVREQAAPAPPDGTPYSEYKASEPPKAEEAALVRCMTADDFFSAEQSASLVVPALGICPGPPTGLVGQAYVGKTIVALSAGMSVALGRPLWGAWHVAQGPWLHLDYEQGRRHTKTRIRRLARGFGVSDEELRDLIAAGVIRIAVHPELRLTSAKALDHYRRAFEGVRFVTADSLRPMIGGVDENSSQVRGLLSILSVASDLSGAAVGLIHHAGKTPADGNERPRKDLPRGSSGIVDEFQSLFVLTKKKGAPDTLVTHEKDRELGEPVADFGLRIEDVPTDDGDPKGGLRVVHVDREQVRRGQDTGDVAFVKTMAGALDCIRDNPGIAGVAAVAQRINVRRVAVAAAIDQLVADGSVVALAAERGPGRRLFLKHAAPGET